MTFVVAAALALVVFVMLANVVTMLLTRHAVRAAVDEAVRVGSRSEAPAADCERRARAVLDGLLGPAARGGVTVSCVAGDDPPAVRATAVVAITPWLPGLPEWRYTVVSEAVAEVFRAPA